MLSFIVQARVGSSRLPNKILLPFQGEKCILEIIIEKLKQVENSNVIIATSDNPNCDPIETVAKKNGVDCFRGDENDVLKRFVDCAEQFGSKDIIRVCSDNPFLDLKSIIELKTLVENIDSPIDYASFLIEGTPSIKTHYGFWTEYVSLPALKKVMAMTDEKLYHEHVTNFIYTHPSDFNIKWIEGPECLKNNRNIRLTTDTADDFCNNQRLFAAIQEEFNNPSIEDVVNYLNSHQEFYVTMIKQIEENSK